MLNGGIGNQNPLFGFKMSTSGSNPSQVMPHDWSRGQAASDSPESEAPERGSCPCEHVRRTAGLRSVDWIGFERRRIRTLCRFQGLDDQSRHNASPAVPATDIKTRDGPSRNVVDRFESLLPVEPGQVLTRSHLTPTNGPLAVKSQQAWRWTLLHDSAECALVLLSRALVIFRADSPIHAPAPIAGATFSEEVFQRRPERGRKRSNCELHVAALRLFLWGPSNDRTSVSASHSWYF